MHPDPTRLSNPELLRQLARAVRAEHHSTAVVVCHLGEVERRGLHRDEGHGSLFDYCVRRLHLSEPAAYARIHAARVARRYPCVLDALASGELHLTAVNLLGPRLTEQNHRELLALASGQSKAEIERLLAARFPARDAEAVVRKLPTRPVPPPAPAQTPLPSSPPEATRDAAATETATTPPSRPSARAQLSPLSAERFKVQLTADAALHDKLQQARHLMRHSVPDGDLARVLEAALDLLIAQRMKQHFAQTDRPRRRPQAEPKPGSRHIPAEVRRAVAERDGMRCSFVSDAGQRCGQQGRLEFHHEEPFARGGPATVENVRLLCQAHNQLLAERDFGPLFMQRKRGSETPAGASYHR